MAYKWADLQVGDVLLMEPNPQEGLVPHLLDLAISFATVSPFVHAAIVADGHIVEALWHVTRSPLSKYEGSGWVYRPQATEEQKAQAVAWAETRVGQRYGLGALLEDAARDILHVPLWAHLNPRSVTCSGLVAYGYEHAGYRLTHAPLPSPYDLACSAVLIGPRPWEPPSGGSTA